MLRKTILQWCNQLKSLDQDHRVAEDENVDAATASSIQVWWANDWETWNQTVGETAETFLEVKHLRQFSSQFQTHSSPSIITVTKHQRQLIRSILTESSDEDIHQNIKTVIT